MEVKTGYKQTEAGLLPVDWEVAPLGGFVRITSGASPSLFRFSGSGIPYFKVEQLSNAEKYLDATDTPYLFERGDTVPNQSVMFAKRGAAIALNKVRILKQASFMDTNLMALTPLDGLECEYLYYALGHIGLWRFADTTSVPQINNKHVKPLPFPLPAPPEQRAIAATLCDVDALLGGLDRLIAKKRALKQATMQQLLTGQTRLPGFHGEWEAFQLGAVADPSRRWSLTGGPFGSNLKSSDYTDDGVRIIQLQNIGDGKFEDDYEIYTSDAKADELLSCNIYPGEIILSKMGDPVARACIIPSRHERYVMCSDGIRLAVDPARFDTSFVFTQINAPDFRDRAANAGTGSTRKRIGLTELRTLQLRCPPLPEQIAIAAVLSDMVAELTGLEAKWDKTRDLKQAMVQELLTGRTRLV